MTRLVKGMVLAHRGAWSSALEPNSVAALKSAAEKGFGIETDFRDRLGSIVVSHDVALERHPLLSEVLGALSSSHFKGVLALNVKADGLVTTLGLFRQELKQVDHFFFDMSIPETLKYSSANLVIAERRSEYETGPSLKFPKASSKTRWIDSFHLDWWLDIDSSTLVPTGSRAFFVSPELHGRDPSNAWRRLRELVESGISVGVCTDFPDDYWAFIGGKDG